MIEPSIPLPANEDVEAIAPGTASVVTWPIIQDLDIQITCRNEESLCISYPRLTEDLWPHWNEGPEGSGTIGLAWVVYFAHGRWVAEGIDWLRSPERRQDAGLPLAHLTQGGPRGDHPFGIFLAGPSRFKPDLPEFRYRSATKWWRWSDLAVIEVDGPAPAPEPEPEPEPELEEVWVYITGLWTQHSGGARVSFEREVGAVDLLALQGQTYRAVDGQVPVGTYNEVAVILDPSRSRVIEGGVEKPLSVPPEVVVPGPFIVNLETSVTLTFVRDQALVKDAEGNWSLLPVVKLTAQSQ
jgi:hypothetical protein